MNFLCTAMSAGVCTRRTLECQADRKPIPLRPARYGAGSSAKKPSSRQIQNLSGLSYGRLRLIDYAAPHNPGQLSKGRAAGLGA